MTAVRFAYVKGIALGLSLGGVVGWFGCCTIGKGVPYG